VRNFDSWLSYMGSRKVPSDVGVTWLKDLWDSYIENEWRNLQGSVAVKRKDASAAFQKAWDETPGLPNANFDPKRVRSVIVKLRDLTQGWVTQYKTENEPTSDDGTLCIYHSFAHVRDADTDNALALCQSWKARRVVAGLPYDDDRCVKAMALMYGFDKWCPLKGDEILRQYTTPGTELIISVYGEVSTVPVKYWNTSTWHGKLHDIKGNVDLDGILATAGTSGHAIYGRVAERGEPEFWDNENNGGKKTTQVATAAKPRRCLVFSRPPH
jgi:hypothetical protein